uniref:AAA_12 domain-containing protein n=1 Tax=Panagrellus redivivus TaxID=6233 RepID=A0A7E4UL46_PANRE
MIRLSKNYRSHESIIDAIGAMFDDPIVAAETFNDTLDLTSITSHPSNRVIFQNVLTDDEELDVIYEYLEKCEKLFQYVDIGIITPYKSQAVIIQQHVDERLGIVVNVVDEFHGIERHAIIISCTLDYDKVIGQNKDTEWLNMAISRAKSLVIIVGRASYLEKLPEGRRCV